MEIMMVKVAHVRGVPREIGDVVEVSEAEALQYTTGGVAENVSNTDKPLKNKSAKATKKR